MLKLPKKLNKGDTIGVISPAGAIKDASLPENAINYLRNIGYEVKIAPNALNKKNYLAGSDEERVFDLLYFFQNPEIKCILCSRGGYGTFRLLDKIQWEIIRENPKIFAGFSDITALLLNIYSKSGLVTFHAPMLISDFGKQEINSYTKLQSSDNLIATQVSEAGASKYYTADNFFKILEGKVEIPYQFNNLSEYKCIKPGQTKGELLGGNLSVICGLLGTPYFPDLRNKILLLEDINEPLYKIDRMLLQLKHAGVLSVISGLLFSELSSVPDANENEIVALLNEYSESLNIPVGFGFPAGHGEVKATLPLGVNYFFDSENFVLEILEQYLINL